MLQQSVTAGLAEFAVGVTFDDLPASTRHATKRLILDSLACAVGGQASPSSRIVAKTLTGLGGRPDSTVLVSGERVPAPAAAFVNCQFANALDADEVMLYTGHVGTVVVPSALSVAEWQNSSGSDLISAVAVGYEVASRIGLSLKLYSFDGEDTIQFPPVRGYSWVTFSSAIAAARLLGLTVPQTQTAMGLAAASAPLPTAGRGHMVRPRPMQKYALKGVYGQAGIMAALLAQAGFTADQEVLDGDRGFWRIIGSTECIWSELTDGLGASWLVHDASFKPYPMCRFGHVALDLYDSLAKQHGFSPADVDSVEVLVQEVAVVSMRMGEHAVETEVDAQFSLPYALGLLANGVEPGPAWQSPASRADTRVSEFGAKVHVSIDSSLAGVAEAQIREHGRISSMPCTITVSAGGSVYSARAEYAKGDPWQPDTVMSDAELSTKFTRFSRDVLEDTQVKAALGVLDDLENEKSLEALVRALVAHPAPDNENGVRRS